MSRPATSIASSFALSAVPPDEDFGGYPPDAGPGLPSPRTLGGLAYAADAGMRAYLVDRDGFGYTIGAGIGLLVNPFDDYTGAWFELRAPSPADNFRLAALAMETFSVFGWPVSYVFTGYDGAAEVASDTVDLTASDSAGSIVYTRHGGAEPGGILVFGSDWHDIDRVRITLDGGGAGMKFVIDDIDLAPPGGAPAPSIEQADWNARTGLLTVSGTDITAGGAIAVGKLTLVGRGGAAYTLTSPDVLAASATGFSIALNAADRAALAPLLNRNGGAASDGTPFELRAAAGWDVAAAADADTAGNAVTVHDVVRTGSTGPRPARTDGVEVAAWTARDADGVLLRFVSASAEAGRRDDPATPHPRHADIALDGAPALQIGIPDGMGVQAAMPLRELAADAARDLLASWSGVSGRALTSLAVPAPVLLTLEGNGAGPALPLLLDAGGHAALVIDAGALRDPARIDIAGAAFVALAGAADVHLRAPATVIGDAAAQKLAFGAGADRLAAGGGHDTASGGDGDDRLSGACSDLGAWRFVLQADGRITASLDGHAMDLVEGTGDALLAFLAAPVPRLESMALLYHAAFGRVPDLEGLAWWSAIDLAPAGAANLFAQSAEWSAATAGLANAHLVGRLYGTALERAATSQETAYWTAALEDGLARADLLQALAFSAEHRALRHAGEGLEIAAIELAEERGWRAGSGDDTLAGGAGFDLLVGGDGRDTVVFAGRRADYTYVREADGDVAVTSLLSGETDILRGMELMRFDDGEVELVGLLGPT